MPEDLLSKLNDSLENEDIENEEEYPLDENIIETEEYDDPLLSIHNGQGLNSIELQSMMARKLTKLLFFAGLPEVGKTTLLNSFYQPIAKTGKLGEYEFVLSTTLVGFEKRDTLCRTSSEKTEPTFERTKAGEMDFLHLEVKDPTTNNHINLVISDFSGEDFKDVLASNIFCKELTILHRVDCFALLIDGGKITNRAERQLAKTNSLKLIDVLLENEMLNPNLKIYIIFTKWDIMKQQIELDSSHSVFINNIENEIKKKLANFEKVQIIKFTRENIFEHKVEDAVSIVELFKSFIEKKENWEYVIDRPNSKPIFESERLFSKIK